MNDDGDKKLMVEITNSEELDYSRNDSNDISLVSPQFSPNLFIFTPRESAMAPSTYPLSSSFIHSGPGAPTTLTLVSPSPELLLTLKTGGKAESDRRTRSA